MRFPLRSLANVRYTPRKGYFELAGRTKERTLTVSTVKTFAQTLRMISLSKQLIETGDFATKRDAYYQTKNWGDARCDEQVESDTIMDDIEGLYGAHKELLHFTPDEHGGLVAGELVVIDREMGTGKVQEIDCTKFGSGAYGIPSAVDDLGFRTKAKFILAIETGGIFERLNRHRFWQKADCILVSMAGVPTRECAASSGAWQTKRRSRSMSSSTVTPTGSATSIARSRSDPATMPTSTSTSVSQRRAFWV
jgi:DNA topoisomerase-6 subunit A